MVCLSYQQDIRHMLVVAVTILSLVLASLVCRRGGWSCWHPLTLFPYSIWDLFALAIENTLEFTPDFDLEPLPLSGAHFPDVYNVLDKDLISV